MGVPAALLDSFQPRAEILVATTWECNLRCTYCFVRENLSKPNERRMSPEIAARLVDVLDQGLDDVKTICLHLYGGEPLTNLPALEALLARTRQKPPGRFCFAITTNGTILSPAVIRLLADGLFQVVLSIDGPAEIHDACRLTSTGEPTHQSVLKFLELLRNQSECRVRGSAVVRSGWSLAEASTYLRSLPVDTLKAQAVRAPDGAAYALSSVERKRYMEDLEWAGRQVIGELESEVIPRDDRFSSRVLQLLTGMQRDTFCGAGKTTFGVTPTGQILPCILLNVRDSILGKIEDEPLVWRQAGLAWRKSLKKRSDCEQCTAFQLCGGGCPVMLPICGPGECDLVRKNCEVAQSIYAHFADHLAALLPLAGIS